MSEINALGVCIDEQLSFNPNVDCICTKAGRQVSALQRLTGVLDYKSRLAIYKSFIMSNFTKMEKKIKKEPWGLSSRSSYEEMLGNLKVDSIRKNRLKNIVHGNLQALKWLESG